MSRQAEEEGARPQPEQAEILAQEQANKAEETALAAGKIAPPTASTPLPTEVTFATEPTSSRLEARVTTSPAKKRVILRSVRFWLAGLMILVVASGIIWFAVQQPSITEFPLPTASGSPGWITAGPDGNLWFTENDGNKIGRISPGGTITEFPLPTAESGPRQIVTGPDGNLWFAEYQGNQIGRISPSGVIAEFPIPTANSGPAGMTTGPDGNLWFTEGMSGGIGKIGRYMLRK